MTLFQKIFKLIFVLILGMGISSCVAKKSGGAAPAAGSDQTAVNRVIGNDGVAADFASNSASLITLSYTDLDSYQASSCSLSRLGNVSESQACSCAAGVCTVGVTSALNYSGAADFYFNVISNGRTSTTGHVTFNITSRPLNTPPVSVNLTPAAFDEDIQSIITLSYSDVENDLASSCSLTNLTNISITRACSCTVGGVCTVGVTGTANYNGAASFNYTVTANASPSNSSSATLSINAINDVPTIPTISTQTTNQNIAKAVSFSIADVDSTVSCTTDITAASSNTTLVPNASIVFSGTAPSCIATITPANNQYGTTNITFTLTDTGTPLPALSTTSMFVFNVTGINTAPVISAIANQTTSEDIATGALAFTISDIDSTVTCADVLGTSANTTLVPSANIVIAGTAPNCTATITPGANQNGVTNLTLTLTDHGMPLPALTATSVFSLTVNAINDIPVISAISAQSTNKNIAKAVTFSISDVDSTVDCSTGMTASSTNVGLVPVVNIVFSGTAPACTATITPVSNQTGTSDITFTVTDTGTPLPALTAASAFTLTVVAINTPDRKSVV